MRFCSFTENPSGMQNFIRRNPTGNVHDPQRSIASVTGSSFSAEYEDSPFVRNLGTHLLGCTASQAR
jgi:hypothetical protein